MSIFSAVKIEVCCILHVKFKFSGTIDVCNEMMIAHECVFCYKMRTALETSLVKFK